MLATLRKTTDALFDTNRRFRQARLFHATRVALALLASIALTTGIDIPHGEWATITVLVVIGGLQHHGNIRRRAAERGIGTLIGALIGLALIVQQSFFGWPLLTYALLALICGYCAYHAIGQGGYIALLAAITVVITAGHGEQNIADAFWRTADVFIGTAIALVFSFALPAYASYSWRIRLAGLLRASMAVHTRMQHGFADSAELRAAMIELGAKLIPLRGLIPSVAKETGVPAAEFEEIQHGARVCISALELMATIKHEGGLREGDDPGIDATLLALADALESGKAPLPTPSPRAAVADTEPGPLPIMARQLAGELASLRARLDRLSRQYGFPYAARL
ncbi:FUSC family protein [Cupriavidus oxalaticus]|uniref:FUSC family protein n=1 Tax=Cupriavidus oxalaticus TaxID=96344 RepID=UPI003177B00E